jgi:predicted nucleic acid-binding protein
MTVVFDAEPLLAFAFDEPGADAVEDWLDRVYDGDLDGYVSTINLAEFRYIAARERSPSQADAFIDDLRDIGLTEYDIDDLWTEVSDVKARYRIAIGDAYAIAAAGDLDDGDRNVTLLVGADDDYDIVEDDGNLTRIIERFRTRSA